MGWYAAACGRQHFPRDWKRAAEQSFRADFVSRHPKALGLVGGKKINGGAVVEEVRERRSGKYRFMEEGELLQLRAVLRRELEEVRGKDAGRVAEIERELGELGN